MDMNIQAASIKMLNVRLSMELHLFFKKISFLVSLITDKANELSLEKDMQYKEMEALINRGYNETPFVYPWSPLLPCEEY